MQRPSKKHNSAYFMLCMVVFVVAFCFSQQAGWRLSCSNSISQKTTEQQIQTNEQSSSPTTEKKCSLSDHLLQLSQHMLEGLLFVISFILILQIMVLAWYYSVPILTEPIPQTRRLHLTLCVFRE